MAEEISLNIMGVCAIINMKVPKMPTFEMLNILEDQFQLIRTRTVNIIETGKVSQQLVRYTLRRCVSENKNQSESK
jgi:hypothetical protein